MKKGTIVVAVPLLAVAGILWLTWAQPAVGQDPGGPGGAFPGPEGLYLVTADGGPLGLVNTFVKVDRDGTYIASGFDVFGLNQNPDGHWDGPQFGIWRRTGPNQITQFDYHQSFSNPFGPPQPGAGIPVAVVRNTFVTNFNPTGTEGTVTHVEVRSYAPNEDPLDPDAGTTSEPGPSFTIRKVPKP